MRVLLAVDPSPDSKNAAQMVKHLAEPPDLHVLNVVDVDALKHAYVSPGMPAEYYERYRAEVAEVAERVLHEMRQELTPWARELRLIADSGDTASSILDTADEIKADVIVLGQRGMTATRSFLLGGISQKVATYARCSVLVVKGSAVTLNRLLLALDGSEEANKALRFLGSGPFKGPMRLRIVTAWPRQEGELFEAASRHGPGPSEPESVQARVEDFLQGVAGGFRGGPYQAETEWVQGDPALAILEAATRHHAQMIVVGARGMKAVKRFFLGSVSQKILVHASCSVLIVR